MSFALRIRPSRTLKSLSRGLVLSVAAGLSGFSASAASDIVILETSQTPKSKQFVDNLIKGCVPCAQAKRINGEGDPRKLETALETIKDTSAKLVITVGTPAADMASQQLDGVKVLSTLSNSGENQIKESSFLIQRADGLINWGVDLAMVVLDEQVKIGVIGGKNAIENAKSDLTVDQKSKIQFFEVRNQKSLPDQISAAYDQTDFVIYLKDPSVVNRRSMDFIVENSIAQNKPTMVFSKALVGMGVPFAISPDTDLLGQRAGIVSDAILRGETLPDMIQPEDFNLHINCSSLKRLGSDNSICQNTSFKLADTASLKIQVH